LIRLLSDEVINRIAAGEVIERPAAVVKELVENALDADSGSIVVRLEAGGRRLISVADDGDGMSQEDLKMAFMRHATSKLTDVEELFHVASLGFRGEALASIGAVSKTRVISRKRGFDEGFMVENLWGEVNPITPAGCPNGTTVEVRDLFSNIQPRLKFLKTESTELSHCVDIVTRFALAHQGVGFELFHNNRKVFSVEKNSSFKDRIAGFFGKETVDALIPVDQELLGVHVAGFFTTPELGRKDMRRSFIFLNGRNVRNKAVHAAVKRAYTEVMPAKFQPVYFIKLGMPTEWIDVNVHPTKIEVRFLDGARVFSSVHKAATQSIANAERLDSSFAGETAGDPFSGFGAADQGGSSSGKALSESYSLNHKIGFSNRSIFEDKSPSETPSETPFDVPQMDSGAPLPNETVVESPKGRILQVHGTYAVFETSSGMAIVDQHALHERIIYEKLKAQYERGGVTLQLLLAPIIIELDPARAVKVNEICFDLNHLGLKAETDAGGALKVTAIPALCSKANPRDLVMEVIDQVAEKNMGEDVYRLLLHRLACRAAVKAGDRLTTEEFETLLKDAEKVGYSGRCPHGRPTNIFFSKKELEELFKRRGF